MSNEAKRELAWVVEGIDYLQDTPGEIADRVLASEWLKAQKANAWDEGFKAGGHHGWATDDRYVTNPYRAEETP